MAGQSEHSYTRFIVYDKEEVMKIVQVEQLKKTYKNKLGGVPVEALKNVNFTVDKGEFVAVMGESGSGKTTLLNLIACLDKPTSGEITINEKQVKSLKDADITNYRREHLGFVFQEFNLLDNFTVKDNIFLPLVLSKTPHKEMESKLQPLAQTLGIETLLDKYPHEISGGQKQRVAVARALITSPDLVLADEPTGALDSKSSSELLELLSSINRQGQTVMMVTHSALAASYASRVLFIKDGVVYHEVYRGISGHDEFYVKIAESLTMMIKGGERIG
jgi:putative ABC transport system ATP-binding protein